MSIKFKVEHIALLTALLAGSSAFASEPATLKLGLSAEVTTLDPHFINTAPNVSFSHHIFETLLDNDAAGRLHPRLAESVKPLNDTTWEVKLRKDVKFHDGSPLTAEDVVYSLDRPATLVNSPGPFTSYTKQITGKEIIDPYTIHLKTASAYGALPLDLSTIYIVSKKAAEKATTEDFNSGKAAIGTGPFKLVSFKRGENIELARNDQYWGDKPEWKKVELKLLPSSAARLNALLAHDVDAIENIPPTDLQKLKQNPDLSIIQHATFRTIFWHLDQFNDKSPDITDNNGQPLDKNPLKDIRVRKAISKAINRTAITERVLEGLGVPASNINSPGILGYNSDIPVEKYDPAEAKKLLAEAGYPDGFSLTIHGPNNRYINDQQIVETTAQYLNKIGIRTKVETQPLTVYLPKAKASEYSVSLLGWGSFATDFTLRTIVGTQDANTGWGTWNWGRYSNPVVDGLVKKALASVDQTQRESYARQAAGAALNDYAVIPLHHQKATWALSKGLTYEGRLDEFTYAEFFHKQ